jgi:hypothetical protein
MARRRRGGWLGLLLGLIILAGLLWVGYWYAARTVAEAAIARAMSGGADGQIVSCTGLSLGGFPLRLDVRCARGTYAGAGQTVTAALGGVAASAPLYWPGYVAADLDSPFVVNAPGLALTTSWSAGTATASAGISGLTGVGASFASLAVNTTNVPPGTPVAALTAAAAGADISPAGGGSYAISGNAKGLNITRADGSTFPEVDGEARLTAVDVGPSLGRDPARTFLAWLRKGGTVNIDRLKIAAAGAIVAVNGSLTLSPTGLLSGTVLIRFNDIKAVAALLDAIKPGAAERNNTALMGLNAVTVPVDTEDGPMRQTALTFTDGAMWLGIIPLPVNPVPPLRF